MRIHDKKRSGFTIVEMLVATALIIFIMVILTQSFVASMDTFRQLKTIGDMEEKLRMATTVLRKDLAADHFEGKKRISDPTFWAEGPPREGFIRIWHGSPITAAGPRNFLEGVDGDGIPQSRVTDHVLHFTVKRRGNRPDEFASAGISDNASPLLTKDLLAGALFPPDSRFQGPGRYASQWYEVAYFLRPSGDVANGTPLFTLYRRQRLAVTDNLSVNWLNKITVADATALANALNVYSEISCSKANPNNTFPDTLYFNSPNDLTMPQRRFGMDPTMPGGVPLVPRDSNNVVVQPLGTFPIYGDSFPVGQNANLRGADILLTNVLSFEVRVLQSGANSDFVDLFNLPASNNSLFTAAAGPRVFDTWSNRRDGIYDCSKWNAPTGLPTCIPIQTQIMALQITIRIWDLKSQTSRQITMVQEL